MNASQKEAATGADDTFEELSAAIESGAGLPAVARAAGKVLDASVALIDRSSAVLAVAAASPDEEGKLLSAEEKTRTLELRVADNPVGELRWRPRGDDEPGPALLRMVTTLLGLELERSRSPEWASEEAAGDFVRSLLGAQGHRPGRHRRPRRRAGRRPLRRRRRADRRGPIPRSAQDGDWRARVMALALRSVRAISTRLARRRGRARGRGRRGRRDRADRRRRPPRSAPPSRSRASSSRGCPASR